MIRTVAWVLAATVAAAASTARAELDKAALYAQLEKHEGKRTKVYKDSEGIATIGIGFNLERPGARKRIDALGVDYDRLVAGAVELSEDQVQELFREDVEAAIGEARRSVSNFDALSDARQRVVVDMVFNLGGPGFRKFRKMIAALEAGEYGKAADEMKDSLWARQVKSRAVTLEKMMRDG